MKTIIRASLMCMLLTLTVQVSADANLDALQKAFTTTIEKAAAERSGFEIKVVTNNNVKPQSYISLTQSEEYARSSLNNVKAYLELYKSEQGSFGPTTQSCSGGIFADAHQSVAYAKRFATTTLTCRANSTAFLIASKVSATGPYFCVDNTGAGRYLTALPKKGVLQCSKGTPVVYTFQKVHITTTTSIFPTSSTTMDYTYSTTNTLGTKTQTASRVAKDGILYQLVNDTFIKTIESDPGTGQYLNKYLIVPKRSYVSEMFSNYSEYVDRIIDELPRMLYKQKVTVVQKTDGSLVYTLPLTNFGFQLIAGSFNPFRMTTSLYKNPSEMTPVVITVKDGLVTNISVQTKVTSGNKSTYSTTLTFKKIKGQVLAPASGKTVPCEQFFSYRKEGAQLCSIYSYGEGDGDYQVPQVSAPAETVEKAKDAVIRTLLMNMRAQSELYYSTRNGYGTARSCSEGMFQLATDGGLGTLVSDVQKIQTNGNIYCMANDTAWVVSTSLVGGGFYCVDSTGVAKEESYQSSYGDVSCR